MTKKNNVAIVVVIIVILVVVAMLTLKNRNKEIRPEQKPLTQTAIDINKAVSSDTTTDITKTINSINIDDTSATDLQAVDQELQKL